MPADLTTADPFEVIDRIRVVPVVVLDDAADAAPLAAAMVAGGLPIAEVTFRTAAAADAIREMSANPEILVGAGTVVTAEQVDQAVAAGARFIVSPGTSIAVIERARELGVPALPGAVTATEVMALQALGLTTVKFFPAGTSGGAKAIAAFGSPFGGISFIPTGGVSADNAADYLCLPNVRAVGGSWMVPTKLVKAGDFDHIEELCRAAVAAAAAVTK